MYHIGIDIGSMTVKVVVIDQNSSLAYQDYRRHHARSRQTAMDMLNDAMKVIGNEPITAALSGSAALKLAGAAKLPFVQEVFATRVAVQKRVGEVEVVVELGGEDAKILFLTNGVEERMNGSCAGGTGAFIDQMAALLDISLEELDRLSFGHKHIYPIASRCGVFAKSDIQPLLNQGAVKADIAASIYQSIVSQTIAGLAQGREIKGRVCFLGGPLTFLAGLRERFVQTLGLDDEHAIFPDHAQYFVALGAAFCGMNEPQRFTPHEILDRLTAAQNNPGSENSALPPLFISEEEYASFTARHASNTISRGNLNEHPGPAYIGIDAGSTTTKLVLIAQDGSLLYDYYAPNLGDPLACVKNQLIYIRKTCGERIHINAAAVTGYGEEFIKNAFGIDFGVVETIAHFTAARAFNPAVDFIIDIGGQDMKCFKLRNGAVDSILLNEACSSGCGSFIEAFANALGYPVAEFARLGIYAKHPVNLGSRCTVFMNSSVKQAQNEGAGVDDISAGLSISVIKNAVYKVVRAKDADELGRNIVAQGGAFLNDAVLRAFEREIGREVIRPAIAGLMGAYGAALYARDRARDQESGIRDKGSSLLTLEELEEFSSTSKNARCGKCGNACGLTINTFPGGRQFISGNRCEKPIGSKGEPLPDAYEFKKELLLSYQPKPSPKNANFVNAGHNAAQPAKIGIPLGLGTYELLPFWHALLSGLGYEVVHSGFSTRELYLAGQHTIPSDTVCYPAKIVHGHIEALLDMGIDTIFYPCLPYNFDEGQGDNHYNCPVVAFYPELLAANIPRLKEARFLAPYFAPHAKSFPALAAKYFAKEFGCKPAEVKAAVQKAYGAYAQYQETLYRFGEAALNYAEDHGLQTVILAGRPYHADPEINHGVHKVLSSLGVVVLSEDCLRPAEKFKVNVLNQWTYHSRLYSAAKFAAENENVHLVQLISFGCGLDAITSDEVKDILEKKGRIYTLLKIDEINNLGAAKIRLRSLLEAVKR